MSQERARGGRRAARDATASRRRGTTPRRRVDLLVGLGILLPTVVAGALALTDADDPTRSPQAPPDVSDLTAASIACPAAASRTAGDVLVTRAPQVDGGEVGVRAAEADDDRLAPLDPVDARPGALASVASDGDVAITGADAAAPGLVAGRAGEARAAAECRAPTYDEWYAGLGASARHSSTIELVNPDPGPAIVEITLFNRRGQIQDEDLHGIRVPGHRVTRVDLAEVSPRRGVLAAHVTVVRGRVTTTVRHTYDPLGRDRPRVDFVPSQPAPVEQIDLPGVTGTAAGAVQLMNPGEDETRASVRVVSEGAVFTPTGLEDVVIPPGTTRVVRLSEVLTDEAADGVLGLRIDADAPLLGSVRLLDDDLGFVGPAAPIPEDEPASAVVPAGPKRLVLAAATRPGVARVTVRDTDGAVLLDQERVEIGADRAAVLELPDDGVVVTVESTSTEFAATVELRDDRVGTLRIRPAEIRSAVPSVRPDQTGQNG